MAISRITPLFQIDPLQLRALLQVILEEVPPLPYEGSLTEAEQRWLSRAETLVEASGSLADAIAFKTARSGLKTYGHDVGAVLAPIYNAYYRTELHCPANVQGRFIAPGDVWTGYAALVRLFQRNCKELFVVDPYVDTSIFLELLPHASSNAKIECLTAKRNHHEGLLAAYRKWQDSPPDNGAVVQFRYAPKGALHDRLIFFDKSEVWLISQSLKDIAKRSPASLARADDDLAVAKFDHYQALWQQSTDISD